MCLRNVNYHGVKGVLLALLLLVALGGGGLWALRVVEWEDLKVTGVPVEAKPVPDKERYEVLVADLQRWRGILAADYKKARSSEQRLAVEYDARVLLEMMLPEMMRCWLGTPWDFDGTAEEPGEGKVACGYFVSTVIRDGGFKVNRYKLAQQPSENILRTFLPSRSCRLEVGKDFELYADAVEDMEHGVYLIGLDTHVGFIVNDGNGLRFIHSSGSDPWCVVEEQRAEAEVLRKSRWRMIGCLTGEADVMATWLKGERVTVRN